jgi:hypothetical protein
MAWENPVTTWGQAGKTVPGAGDFNRIEGNTQYLKDEIDSHYSSGSVTYTDTIAALATITKTIPIGANKRQGRLFVRNASMGGPIGVSVFFTTSQTRSIGIGYDSTEGFIYATAWNGSVADGYSILGADTEYLRMQNAYISGTNLVIIFKNDQQSTAKTLNARVEWEVW